MTDPLIPLNESALTTLLITVFRLNGALLAAGDRLVRDLGLTSARWQVLGVAAAAPVPLPIASIARNMGLTRQGVRQVVSDLEQSGLVRFAPNPHHRRAHLVVLTPKGEEANRAALARQAPWAAELGRGLDATQVKDAADLLAGLLQRLDGGSRDEGRGGRSSAVDGGASISGGDDSLSLEPSC